MKRLRATSMDSARSGQAMVELALIMLLLMLIVMALFEFGRAFFAYIAISNAAREGARYGVIHPTARDADGLPPYDPDSIEGRGAAQTFILDMDRMDVQVVPPSPLDSGDPITVTVRYDFNPVTPFISMVWGGGSWSFRSSATMYIE